MGSLLSAVEDIPSRTLGNAERNPLSIMPEDSRDLIIHKAYQELEFSKAASKAPTFRPPVLKGPLTRAMTSFPYTYISCPCTDIGNAPSDDDDKVEQERTFDPNSPRANFSLYPLEHLMYCEDCQQIRCPRCTIEEIVCWYCPTCLFEMPSSMLRSDGYR